MASFVNRNGRIRAHVVIKPLPRRSKTFDNFEAAKIWSDKTEAHLRAIRANGHDAGLYLDRAMSTDAIMNLPRTKVGTFSGVYFLFSGEKCVYVGKAANVHSRAVQHADKDFDAYAWIPCTEDKLEVYELYYIKLLAPKYNIVGLPNYRERIAILREANELPHSISKMLGSLDDLPKSVQSIIGAAQKR